MDETQNHEPIVSTTPVEETTPPVAPPPETPAPEPETPPEVTPVLPTEPAPEPKKGKGPLIALLVILLLAVIGACVYLLLLRPKPTNNNQNNQSAQEDVKPAEGTEDDVDKDEPETVIEDQDTISTLFKKVLILHRPDIDNFLSYTTEGDSYSSNQYFSFGSVYDVSDQLYSGGLTEGDKFHIVTEYMQDQKQLKPAQDYGVPSNYYAIRNADYCSDGSEAVCSNSDWIQAASEDEVATVYASIFGEKPTSFENPTGRCHSLSYDSDYQIYYTGITGCGGGDGPVHQAYVEQYAETGNKAYVYIRIASINVYDGADVPVYKTFIGYADISDPETGLANVTPDESLVYSRLGSGGMGMSIPRIINSENYTEFQQYRFVFQKDDNGNYYFKTVEKL